MGQSKTKRPKLGSLPAKTLLEHLMYEEELEGRELTVRCGVVRKLLGLFRICYVTSYPMLALG